MLGSSDSDGASGTTKTRPSTSLTISQWDRRFGQVEERVGTPDVVNVVDPEVRMLEQVGGLVVDLERVVLVKQVEVEGFSHIHLV